MNYPNGPYGAPPYNPTNGYPVFNPGFNGQSTYPQGMAVQPYQQIHYPAQDAMQNAQNNQVTDPSQAKTRRVGMEVGWGRLQVKGTYESSKPR